MNYSTFVFIKLPVREIIVAGLKQFTATGSTDGPLPLDLVLI